VRCLTFLTLSSLMVRNTVQHCGSVRTLELSTYIS
jgi:hypothetical protein